MADQDWNELERASQAASPEIDARAASPAIDTQAASPALWLSLRGRISRRTYWLKFALPIFALQFVSSLVDVAGGLAAPGDTGPFNVLASVLVIWPSIVGLVKRLHDLEHPGWFVLAYYGGAAFTGMATAIAVVMFGAVGLVALAPFGVLLLLAIWYSIKVMFFRGTIGPNRYGPDPVG